MGYRSEFTIELNPPEIDRFLAIIDTVSEYGMSRWLEKSGSALYTSEMKWYSWEEELKAASKYLPDITLTCEQLGEDGEGNRVEILNGEVTNRKVRGWI